MAAPTLLHDHVKLRAWREAAGLSREQVAVQTGLSCSWITALELGSNQHGPSLGVLRQLAGFYGHAPGELLLPAQATAS